MTSRLSALIPALALTVGLGLPPAVHAGETQGQMAETLGKLGSYPETDHRFQVTVKDCLYTSERWEALAGGPEMVTGIVTFDLRHVDLAFPELLRSANEYSESVGREPGFSDKGNAIAYLGEGHNISGSLSIVGSKAHPILREEHVSRDRTKQAIRRGETRPSPRGDGISYVFRDSTQLSFLAKGKKRVAQLEKFEQTFRRYQENFCSKATS